MKNLDGKLIVLAVTGSIAAVETVKLAHELKRRGACVQAVMSDAATHLIHPDALTYACGRETITRISGLVEHVTYCGDDHAADLLLIAPATANTISKIAGGIDDTPVTTFATTAIGSGVPIILVPAMHYAMFRHPAVMENLERMIGWGVTVVGPRIEEGKAKIADISDIVLHCEREMSEKPLLGQRVLITSGRCEEPVDDVRVLTTRSSGQMGKELALAAFRLGADVTIIHRDDVRCVRNIRSDTAASMLEAVSREFAEKDVDLYMSAAAVSDYAPVRHPGKIPGGHPVTLDLRPLPKILDLAIPRAKVTVAFKVGEKSTEEAGILLEKGVALVAANAPAVMGSSSGTYTLIDRTGMRALSGSKDEIADGILRHLIADHHPGSRKANLQEQG